MDFFSTTPSNFSFGLPFVVFAHWLLLLVLVGWTCNFAQGSTLPLHQGHRIRFGVSEDSFGWNHEFEVTLVEAVAVDVGLERVTKQEDNLMLTFQYTMDRCEHGGRQKITHQPQGGVSLNSGYQHWAG